MNRNESVLRRLKGPVVPINICFYDDGTVNFDAVAEYVNWLCEHQAPILLLTYGSSEFAALTEEDVWKLTEVVGRANAGRSLFIASSGWWPARKTRRFLAHAEAAGADAVKIQIHVWFPKTKECYLPYYDALEGASALPLLIWGHSPPSVPLEVITALAQREYVVGIKNDGDPFYEYYDMIRATRDMHFAVVSGGQMRNFMLGYPLGAAAYLCPIAPFRPDIALEFYRCLTEDRFRDAWQMVFRYEEPWLKAALGVDWLFAMKTAIRAQGVNYPNPNPASVKIKNPAEQEKKIRKALKDIFGIE